MSTHTKSPWHVEDDDLIVAVNGDAVAKVYLSITAPETGAYNADPSRGSDDGRVLQLKANACLIAAAPEMLKALRTLCAPDVSYIDGEIRIPLASHGDALNAMRLAREVIAKAEGRS